MFPCAGAVASLFKGYDAGYKGLIPPYIVLTQSQGRFSEAGFLGARHMPFATGGDPAQQRFMVEGVVSPGLNDQQQEKRRELLRKLNTLGGAVKDSPALTAFYEAEDQAYDMILGDGAKAFDLSQETDDVRARYDVDWGTWVSRTRFGQSCTPSTGLQSRGGMARCFRLGIRTFPNSTFSMRSWQCWTSKTTGGRVALPSTAFRLLTLSIRFCGARSQLRRTCGSASP